MLIARLGGNESEHFQRQHLVPFRLSDKQNLPTACLAKAFAISYTACSKCSYKVKVLFYLYACLLCVRGGQTPEIDLNGRL